MPPRAPAPRLPRALPPVLLALASGSPAAPTSDEELRQCEALNELEARVGRLAGGGSRELGSAGELLERYRIALAQWRARWPSEQPPCRVRALGAELCGAGARQQAPRGPRGGGGSPTWRSWMRQLAGHERNQSDCASFSQRYFPEGWHPQVFHWPLMLGHTDEMDQLSHDEEYSTLYARALHSAYGAPQVPWLTAEKDAVARRFRLERARHLLHFRVLRKALPHVDVIRLKQVLDYGGGTGDMAAAAADLGFAGTYVIYDLPPMTLMQRYWLRYSGLPAHLGSDLPTTKEAARGQLVLESSLGSIAERHLDAEQLHQSLFVGTYSFTESDFRSRERIRPLMMRFGIILLTFVDIFDSLDNVAYLQGLGQWLLSTHRVLVWHKGHNHWYFLAVRMEVGKIHCDAAVNCGIQSLHPSLRFDSTYVLVDQAVGCAPNATVADAPPFPGLDDSTASVGHPSGLTFRELLLRPSGPEDDSRKIERIRSGVWEAVEDPFIQGILDSDPNCTYPVFVDGGAAFGYYSLLAAQKHACREIQAFNPHPQFAYAMRLNVQDNARAGRLDPRRLCANRAALSHRPRSLRLAAGYGGRLFNGSRGGGAAGGPPGVEVPVTSLDAFFEAHVPLEKRVILVKLDIEGEEANTLRGATRLLEGCRVKNWVISLHNHRHWSTVLRVLRRHRYRITFSEFEVAGQPNGMVAAEC